MRVFINMCMGLGDSIYTLQPLYALAQKNPDWDLTCFGWDSTVQLVKAIPGVAHVIFASQFFRDHDFESKSQETRIHVLAETFDAYDIYVDFQKTKESALWAAQAHITRRIALDPHPEVRHCYTDIYDSKENQHVTDLFDAFFADLFSVSVVCRDDCLDFLDLRSVAALRDRIFQSYQLSNNAPIVGVHPGAKNEPRQWDNYKWAQLVTALGRTHHAQVLIFASAFTRIGRLTINDRSNARFIQRFAAYPCCNLAGQTQDTRLLAALIKECSLYIGLDTGPTHLAHVLGIPTIELFYYTSDACAHRWCVRGNHSHVLCFKDLNSCLVEDLLDAREILLAQCSVRHNGKKFPF